MVHCFWPTLYISILPTILLIICFVGDRLWVELLRTPAYIHLHTVAVLPCPGSHSRLTLRPANWHVESGLYTCRTGYRVSSISWRGRGRPASVYYRAVRNAAGAVPRHLQACAEFCQLEGSSPLLRRDGNPGRRRPDCRRAFPAWEIPRPAGNPGPVDCAEVKRHRVGIYRLSSAMPGLGTGWQNDPAAGSAPRLAATEGYSVEARDGRKRRIAATSAVVGARTFLDVCVKDEHRGTVSAGTWPAATDETGGCCWLRTLDLSWGWILDARLKLWPDSGRYT